VTPATRSAAKVRGRYPRSAITDAGRIRITPYSP
jgi:hypothetical protein